MILFDDRELIRGQFIIHLSIPSIFPVHSCAHNGGEDTSIR